ncbi:hypothetical protein UCDDS831_g02031 [Diplodia seriata]|uniref:Uncharacterized protein n=1 Tax=Diplodia seriata TaxID=420778 RepID=A0A0G2GQQ9_9PEZI|nr:hypothetical protein UCDDS831_g02031 [Diplodia seriata]
MERNTWDRLKSQLENQMSGGDDKSSSGGDSSSATPLSESPGSKEHGDPEKSAERSLAAQLEEERKMRLHAEKKVAKLRIQRHMDANRLLELGQRNAELERQGRVDAGRLLGLEEMNAGRVQINAELTDKLRALEDEKKTVEQQLEQATSPKRRGKFSFF